MSQNVGFKFEEFEIIEEEWTEINLRELNAHLTDEEFEEAQKIWEEECKHYPKSREELLAEDDAVDRAVEAYYHRFTP